MYISSSTTALIAISALIPIVCSTPTPNRPLTSKPIPDPATYTEWFSGHMDVSKNIVPSKSGSVGYAPEFYLKIYHIKESACINKPISAEGTQYMHMHIMPKDRSRLKFSFFGKEGCQGEAMPHHENDLDDKENDDKDKLKEANSAWRSFEYKWVS